MRAPRQSHRVRLQAKPAEELNGRVDCSARQYHQFHSDAPALEVPFDHVYIVVDGICRERCQTIHLERQHLTQVFLRRRRQIDQFAQCKFLRQP
jgi:hypothetical protein